ncbi:MULTISPECIES: FadR/GntR family transcriptional regulator [Kocuria]|uniref:FadR family transcriptional regulator n=1 Tax=Kocuria subflava TaxID=1736139 RepID=A0A846TUB5_9MICC|nr:MULTISPECIES: GntR family transcriptional regulator [Kocuria]NKE10409.1 FadR family transcriptional regulator [Kocuria subflava]
MDVAPAVTPGGTPTPDETAPPPPPTQAGVGAGHGRSKDDAPTYTVVLSWVEAQLSSGALSVGQKLPGERALAEEFDISRASVREAIRVLVAMGLVRSGTGSGTKAGAVVVSEPSAALSWALRMHVATKALPMADVVAMRVLLETQSALAAGPAVDHAERAAVLERVRGYLEEMDQPEIQNARFHDLDARFHVELTSLGGNVVLTTVMQSLRDAVIGYVEQSVAHVTDWAGLRARLQAEHWAILAAFEAAEPVQAAALLKQHIEGFHATVLAARA